MARRKPRSAQEAERIAAAEAAAIARATQETTRAKFIALDRFLAEVTELTADDDDS